MAVGTYSLAEVMAVAESHPFYNKNILYPSDPQTVTKFRDFARRNGKELDFQQQPLLNKKILYKSIERLTHDVDPRNTYRHGSYMSITGGGSGAIPMMFAVDVHENRRQRARMGDLLRICGVIEPKDMVLSTHLAGGFYRSLDLTTEIIENAGGTVLSAGAYMPPAEVAQSLANYHVNALTGDGSQIVQTVQYISVMAKEDRERIVLNKIIYTSEPLTGPQRVFIKSVLGDVKIFSIMGSAEAGPWAISSPKLTGERSITEIATDFIFDTRSMLLEIFPPSVSDDIAPLIPKCLPQGEKGIIVQTSLQRLRNPLVRYITGDIGSIHLLPDTASAVDPDFDRKFLRILRMQGRDHRFSFKWHAAYFEFQRIEAFMREKEYGVLQWQIILGRLDDTPQASLEIRLLRSPPRDDILSVQTLTERLESFFLIIPENKHLARIVFLNNLNGFERSITAGKVIKFVDHWH
ncbi:uncharacterized protein EAE98_010038 [Botrytis deweyae]|uniref:AMP-dependent synthetase/ligase domain-containing protein n=1 Tax=Botrytis deweyae TaxID=2478750 RepID=A0ABQ7I9L1_9HELO|nr:uncharacterized protein EAE98_010038 [Botrytis deweyae]KAF7917622.1 hypothetical protein EAE98_010038 [Botrytis deweyae]